MHHRRKYSLDGAEIEKVDIRGLHRDELKAEIAKAVQNRSPYFTQNRGTALSQDEIREKSCNSPTGQRAAMINTP
jgi:hypothetical protein